MRPVLLSQQGQQPCLPKVCVEHYTQQQGQQATTSPEAQQGPPSISPQDNAQMMHEMSFNDPVSSPGKSLYTTVVFARL